MSDIIVGLDIGTSFIRVVIAEVHDGGVEIIGVAKRSSTGLRNGVIVNIEATIECIKQAVEAAEQKAGYEVISCVTGIGGAQIEGMNSKGLVAVSAHGKNNREINESDVNRVLEAANAIQIPMDRKMLHVIPQDYIVDGVPGYKDPIHMIAVRLEAEVHIVTASRTAIQNITQCVERAGYQLDRVMLKSLACTQVVVGEDERELGSILIDVGGSMTDILVILKDAPICTASIPLGGNAVTNDISIVKGIATATAEKIKIESGCCWLPLALERNDEVLIPGLAGREPEQIDRKELCEIIMPRMEEIFMMVRDAVVRRISVGQLMGSIILTGGGAQIEGAVELAERVFGTSSVRLGVPGNWGGIEEEYRQPEYATAVGLVVANRNLVQTKSRKDRRHRESERDRDAGDSLWQKIKKSFF
ncbi:MAG: cell division protein FtsA [Treponema sp.]|nr:cell division protein FtsA [Treponema sp.]